MNLGHSQAGGQHGGKGYKGTTGSAGLTTPWQAGAGSLGPPELTTPLCTSVASSIKQPHSSTCSNGATVRITRLDAAGRKWPQDTKTTPAALQKQQGGQKKRQVSTRGRLKAAEQFPPARNTPNAWSTAFVNSPSPMVGRCSLPPGRRVGPRLPPEESCSRFLHSGGPPHFF